MKALAFTAIIALLAGDASAQEVTAHKAAFGYIMESFVAGNSVVPEVMHRIDDDVEFDASDWHCSAYKPRSGANQRITMEVGCSQGTAHFVLGIVCAADRANKNDVLFTLQRADHHGGTLIRLVCKVD
jgi:hypothetical protein